MESTHRVLETEYLERVGKSTDSELCQLWSPGNPSTTGEGVKEGGQGVWQRQTWRVFPSIDVTKESEMDCFFLKHLEKRKFDLFAKNMFEHVFFFNFCWTLTRKFGEKT